MSTQEAVGIDSISRTFTRLLSELSSVLHAEAEAFAELREAGVSEHRIATLYPFDMSCYRERLRAVAANPSSRETLARLLAKLPMRDAFASVNESLNAGLVPAAGELVYPPAERFLGVQRDEARLVTQQLVYCLSILHLLTRCPEFDFDNMRATEIYLHGDLEHHLVKIRNLIPMILAACAPRIIARQDAEIFNRTGWGNPNPWEWC